jgi:Ca2+/Na+ antiporter
LMLASWVSCHTRRSVVSVFFTLIYMNASGAVWFSVEAQITSKSSLSVWISVVFFCCCVILIWYSFICQRELQIASRIVAYSTRSICFMYARF